MNATSSTQHQCRICGEPGVFPEFTAREMMFGTRDLFTYFQCSACETLQIDSVPDGLGKYYGDQYYSYDPVRDSSVAAKVINGLLGIRESSYVLKRSAMTRLFNRVIPPVEHTRLVLAALAAVGVRRNWRILDVGCGSGTVLHRLRSGGFKSVCGVDPFIPKTLTYRNGLEILKCDLQDVPGTWDLITFHHSLEHMPNPEAMLLAAKNKLNPGGLILIRIPTVSSEVWEHYRTDWVQLDAPRHLFLLSRKALQLTAARAGLTLRGSYDDSTALQFYGSELLKADIPLTSDRSYLKDPAASIFSAAQITQYGRQAAELNAKHRGDQIVAWFSAG